MRTILLLACSACAACTTGAVTALDPVAAPPARLMSAKVEHGVDTVTVSSEVARDFARTLRHELDVRGFAEGEALTVSYRFTRVDQGSARLRTLLPMAAGQGELLAEVTYRAASGATLATTTVEGQVAAGFHGGSYTLAVHRAAREAARFAQERLGVR